MKQPRSLWICHGLQILASAGLLNGRHVAGYQSIDEELRLAGAFYEDKDVIVDGNLITSRKPANLLAFMREIMRSLGH